MYPKVKRWLDAGAAAVLLATFLPLMMVLALLLCATQPGPALFSQTRVGKGDKPFTIHKFCTLYPDGTRKTPLGAWLRRWSLDELPQLWNILVGEMSFVGPRPVVPSERELLAARRFYGATGVLPGLTGLAQVRGRKRLSAEEKARCDAYYCKEMSFSLDLYILWRTLFCVHSADESPRKKPLTNA